MRRFVHRVLAVALLALVVPALSGCEMRLLRVIIPDFETSAVEGVQVWRLDDATGQPVLRGRLVFQGSTQDRFGMEVVEYAIVQNDGTQGYTLMAEVERDSVDPDRVELDLYYTPRDAQGWYKVSTFNAVGASPLSTAQTYLTL